MVLFFSMNIPIKQPDNSITISLVQWINQFQTLERLFNVYELKGLYDAKKIPKVIVENPMDVTSPP